MCKYLGVSWCKEGSTAVFGSTFTDEQDVVVAEAHRTFTAEAPDLVDANSVGADSGDLSALVDIWTTQQHGTSERNLLLDCVACVVVLTDGFSGVDVNDEAGSLVTAQQPILRWKRRRDVRGCAFAAILGVFYGVCGHSQEVGVGQDSHGLFQAFPTL